MIVTGLYFVELLGFCVCEYAINGPERINSNLHDFLTFPGGPPAELLKSESLKSCDVGFMNVLYRPSELLNPTEFDYSLTFPLAPS